MSCISNLESVRRQDVKAAISFPVTKVVRQTCAAASTRRAKALMREGPKNESRVGSGSAVSSPAGLVAQSLCSVCF